MSLQETKSFLVDLLARFDSTLDTRDGGRVASELIEPILTRIGPDPFDADITTFISTRIQQSFPQLAITEADELTDLLIDPMRILIEPLTREIKLVKLRQSLRNLDVLADDEVDALMGNFFIGRRPGSYSLGVVRAYYVSPQTVTVTLINMATTKSGLRFVPYPPQQITADQMLLNVDGSEYYVDFNYTAESPGTEYDIEPGEINSIANLPTATRVVNLRRFRGGQVRETNQEFVARVQESTSDKTLTTHPGIIAVLGESFPDLRQIFEVGSGDPEMQRDVVRGGSLGSIPADDDLGGFAGTGQPSDDLDADTTSGILEAALGYFTARIGAVGFVPTDWYVTLVYTSGSLVVVDAKVLEVLSATTIRTDHEMPLTLGAAAVVWALRRKQLSISAIPGGIVFPDTVSGNLEIASDSIHIGGKTDIYVAGSIESSSAQISSLSDETPLARGFSAQTVASSADVTLSDADSDLLDAVTPGMTLVLSKGVDAGPYRILHRAGYVVTVATAMTGTLSDLTWRIVDDIDVNLMVPRDILVEGSDLVLGAGSAEVTTSSSLNFAEAGVSVGDTLFVNVPLGGGEFSITSVLATTCTMDPPAPRTLSGAPYKIYRKYEGVQAPVVRVKSLELLDASGGPTGTTVPHRNAVLVASNAFQNEGSGYAFDGLVTSGLVGAAISGTSAVSGLTLVFTTSDPAAVWAGPLATTTFNFGVVVPLTIQQVAAAINADTAVQTAQIRCTVLTSGGATSLGFTSPRHLAVTGGTAASLLGLTLNYTNNSVLVAAPASFAALRIRRGDVLEFVGGNNAGKYARCIADPDTSLDFILVGSGPLGPPGTTALYDTTPLNPEIGGRVRIARPSVGSMRAYFLAPTSVDFRYQETRFVVTTPSRDITFAPDPENLRVVRPPYPVTELPKTGVTTAPGTLTDTGADFRLYQILPGDILEILYVPIVGDTPLLATTLVGGLNLRIRINTSTFTNIEFPYDMPRADVVTYINGQLGQTVAALNGVDCLVLSSSSHLEIDSSSSALAVLYIAVYTNDHVQAGSYVIASLTATALTLSNMTPMVAGSYTDTYYRIKRYVQRCSSTEMNTQVDAASGLFYVDVESVALLGGDYNNIGAGLRASASGYRSDGYALSTENEVTSFSRAEVMHASIGPTMLLIGSADSPENYVQLNQQAVQVSYDRSSDVDDVQSFCNSRFRRVLCEEILVRHMSPHYVSLSWSYTGGSAEPVMSRALSNFLDGIGGGESLEVGALRDVMVRLQATSVFTPDSAAPQGRRAPTILVISHGLDRSLQAEITQDLVTTVRTQRYLADTITLRRLSSSGVR